jgi:hypothetical protein
MMVLVRGFVQDGKTWKVFGCVRCGWEYAEEQECSHFFTPTRNGKNRYCIHCGEEEPQK